MKMLLDPGVTCWRVETAPRAAFLLDIADYFAAAKDAMSKAQRSIHLLNWAFDPDTQFEPRPGGDGADTDAFGPYLKALASDRPDIDVRVLCWKSALPVAATQRFFPIRAKHCFSGSPVRFVLDGALPTGASHHQKMIIIDDALAFCGGADIGPDRWDTSQHLDDDPRRRNIDSRKKFYDSRHEAMSVVDGPAATALGRLFRLRWARATGETLVADETEPATAAWPDCVPVDFHDISVGLSRTSAVWRKFKEVRESEALYLASIAAAKRCIYLENQYFTSPIMAEALADRLAEPSGPEVVLISAQHSPSYFDKMTMDRTRSLFLKRLKAADRFGRFRAYSPVTTEGRIIIVHAKLAVIDDVLLRIGSSNMNNRSEGFDTECDLSLEAGGATGQANAARITALRTRMIAHWLGCADNVVEGAIAKANGVGDAIEALRSNGHCRLRPIEPKPLDPLALFVAMFHIGDPIAAADCWRPWKRRKLIATKVAQAVERLRRARLPAPEESALEKAG